MAAVAVVAKPADEEEVGTERLLTARSLTI